MFHTISIATNKRTPGIFPCAERYPTMHHFATEMCTYLVRNGALGDMEQKHWGICATRRMLTHECLIKMPTFCKRHFEMHDIKRFRRILNKLCFGPMITRDVSNAPLTHWTSVNKSTLSTRYCLSELTCLALNSISIIVTSQSVFYAKRCFQVSCLWSTKVCFKLALIWIIQYGNAKQNCSRALKAYVLV